MTRNLQTSASYVPDNALPPAILLLNDKVGRKGRSITLTSVFEEKSQFS